MRLAKILSAIKSAPFPVISSTEQILEESEDKLMAKALFPRSWFTKLLPIWKINHRWSMRAPTRQLPCRKTVSFWTAP